MPIREEERAGAALSGEGAREEVPEHDLEHPGMPEGLEDQLVVPVEASRRPDDRQQPVRDRQLRQGVEVPRRQALRDPPEPPPPPSPAP